MVAAGTSALTIDTTGLRAYARSLRSVAPAAYVALRGRFKEIADEVANEAKRLCESEQARPTITPHVSGVNARVTAGTTIGRLQEKGNKGGSGKSKNVFRHPTGYQGTGPWVDQPMHPFLSKALENKRDEIVDKIKLDMDELARRYLAGEYSEDSV